jgi:4-hydroxybenzoyl-CoA reductase subunit beta
MPLPKFDYTAPKTAARAIFAQKSSGKFLAGGTDLFVAMKERIVAPDILVDLGGIARLKGIKWDRKNNELRVGALTTLSRFSADPFVLERFPFLDRAVSLVSTRQLRNMGTVGGNLCLDTRCCYYNQTSFLKQRWEPCLKIGGKICHVVKGSDVCHAVYSGDMAGILIALGAGARVEGDGYTEEMYLREFFTGSGLKPNILKFNEILTEVSIPPLCEYSGFSYRKLRLRDTVDFPLLGVAVFVRLDGKSGKCRNVRLVLSAVGPAPVVVEEASRLMRGKHITAELIDEVSQAARKTAHPVANTASSPGFRREMIPVYIRKAFGEALERIELG